MRWQNSSGQIVTTEQLLGDYRNLDATNSSSCNIFFQTFGPGNITAPLDPLMHLINKPYERLAIYLIPVLTSIGVSEIILVKRNLNFIHLPLLNVGRAFLFKKSFSSLKKSK